MRLCHGFIVRIHRPSESDALTAALECTILPTQLFVQFTGCTVIGIGIAFEVQYGFVTMLGVVSPLTSVR